MHPNGFVVWFTGLPCLGKSTLARLLEKDLRRRGLRVEVLDGDEVRQRTEDGRQRTDFRFPSSVFRPPYLVKGFYRRALAGEIQSFTGVSDPYEEPLNPELVVETDQEDPKASLRKILTGLEEMGYRLPSPLRGMTSVPIPTYLIQKIEARLKGGSRKDPSTYIIEVVSRALAEEEEVAALTVEENASIEARLKALGYLE